MKTVDMQNSRVVMPHGLDGVHDLWNLIVDHTVQLAVSHAISVHNDARRQAVVELQIVFKCTWKTNTKVMLRLLRELMCVLK